MRGPHCNTISLEAYREGTKAWTRSVLSSNAANMSGLAAFLSSNAANVAVRAPTAPKPKPSAAPKPKPVPVAAPVEEEPKTALGSFLKASSTASGGAKAKKKSSKNRRSKKIVVEKDAAAKNSAKRGNAQNAANLIYAEHNITEKAVVYGVDEDGDAWSEDEMDAAETAKAVEEMKEQRIAEDAANAAVELEREEKRLAAKSAREAKSASAAMSVADAAASARPMSCALSFTPACEKSFMKLKKKRKHRFVIYHITGDGFLLDVESASKRKLGPADLIKALAPNECRFAVYDHEFVTHDERKTGKIYFLFWAPAGATAESKVHYSHQKHACKKLFKNIDEVRICNKGDLQRALAGVEEEVSDEDEGSWDPDA